MIPRSAPPRFSTGDDGRILLILDLDETLVHAQEPPFSLDPHCVLFGYGIHLRPGLTDFLHQVTTGFRLAVWTSSSLDYASHVCNLIFPDPTTLEFIWARDKCTRRWEPESQTEVHAKRLAKLTRFGYDLRRVLVVDDSPEKHEKNYGNLVRISAFEGDPADAELLHLAKYLHELSQQPDMRRVEKRGWRSRRNTDRGAR
ncbi:RNA polymerase II subunit A small phosphatase-like protein [Povalibacter uvarum]|uniref:RNA polymerase II subunit A small phosphatase-like protein n=1 Tax=Povalibacter uvarum TaxID=732238 RepID=A0A841HUJ4_9GAMM|nr:RNA polymerase II subunit A small phosphatase-like protein [Povalibacter uvarum]